MNSVLRSLLDKIYSISERKFVGVNIVLAVFVALAHGGALAVTYAKLTPDASEIRQLASISLPLATIVIVSAIVALVYARQRQRVLALHGIVLIAGVSSLLFWALGVLINGVPEGRFIWTAGFLTASVCYASVLFCRFSIPTHLRSSSGFYYAPIFALISAALVDAAVYFQVAA